MFCCLLEDGMSTKFVYFRPELEWCGDREVELCHFVALHQHFIFIRKHIAETSAGEWATVTLSSASDQTTSNWITEENFRDILLPLHATLHRQIVGENEQQMDHVNHHGNVVHTECSCDHGFSDNMLEYLFKIYILYMLIYRAQLFSYFFSRISSQNFPSPIRYIVQNFYLLSRKKWNKIPFTSRKLKYQLLFLDLGLVLPPRLALQTQNLSLL